LQEHGSVKNYLINRLNVDEKLLEEVITTHPSILRVKFKKLIELIDMLRQNGITQKFFILELKRCVSELKC